VTMKFTPHLLFHLDESVARGSRVVEILQQIDSDSRKNE
jgi:ribosome-binding factor A